MSSSPDDDASVHVHIPVSTARSAWTQWSPRETGGPSPRHFFSAGQGVAAVGAPLTPTSWRPVARGCARCLAACRARDFAGGRRPAVGGGIGSATRWCARPREAATIVFGLLVGCLIASAGMHWDGDPAATAPRGWASAVADAVSAVEAGAGGSGAATVRDATLAPFVLRLPPPPVAASPPPRPPTRSPTPTHRVPRSRGPPAVSRAGAGSTARGDRTLELFLAWVGAASPPYAQLQRVLDDVVGQTAAARVTLHLMVEDTPAAEADAELQRRLAAVAARGDAVGAVFDWALYSFVAFRDSSAYYGRLCADFQANIFHANAKEYACQFLVKPLLWEIVPPRAPAPAQHFVVALDTDLRISGDLLDIIDEHAPAMAARGALMALTAEQQPTYAFNSPDSVRGFNGGVQVIDVAAMAASAPYHALLAVFRWVDTDPRWRPATDLGDQTLYSIFNYSHPAFIVEMGCGWNRQLCRVWFTVFAARTPRHLLYQYELDGLCRVADPRDIRVLHANCRSQRPGSDELDGLPDTWQDRNGAAEAELEATFNREYAAEVAAGGAIAPPEGAR